jgi:cell wall-associated NlpC family hydrolase
VLRAFSVAVSRDCVQQVREGRRVASLDEAVPGDLVYFAPAGESAQHVGMLLPCGEIIHASAMVRIDDLTPEGIVNRESGELSHRFLAIRRIMPVG